VLETPQWGIERPNQKNSKKHPLQTQKPPFFLLATRSYSMAWVWNPLLKAVGVFLLLSPVIGLMNDNQSPRFVLYTIGWNIILIGTAIGHIQSIPHNIRNFFSERFSKSLFVSVLFLLGIGFFTHLQVWKEDREEIKRKFSPNLVSNLQLSKSGTITIPGTTLLPLYLGKYDGMYIGKMDEEDLRSALEGVRFEARNTTIKKQINLSPVNIQTRKMNGESTKKKIFSFSTKAGVIEVKAEWTTPPHPELDKIIVIKHENNKGSVVFLKYFGGLVLGGAFFFFLLTFTRRHR
jgi:hypothetical protein